MSRSLFLNVLGQRLKALTKVDVDGIYGALGCSEFVKNRQVLVNFADMLEKFKILLVENSYERLRGVWSLFGSFILILLLLIKMKELIDY